MLERDHYVSFTNCGLPAPLRAHHQALDRDGVPAYLEDGAPPVAGSKAWLSPPAGDDLAGLRRRGCRQLFR